MPSTCPEAVSTSSLFEEQQQQRQSHAWDCKKTLNCTGGDDSGADVGSSGQEASGHQVVFMWQAGQGEAHYREAVSGAHVHRCPALAPPCVHLVASSREGSSLRIAT